MKIKIITCHDVYNLGASLQAYALQTFLLHDGYDVEIINYKPDYLSRHFDLWMISNSKFDKPILKQLYLLAKLPPRLLALRRKSVFDKFTSKYLRLTKRYCSYNELKKDPPLADVYVAGSDQIWNTLFENGRDKAFYCDFGEQQIKRISYAASFATPTIASGYEDFVMNELKKMDYVSVRERLSLPLLQKLGRADGVAVCDPVFLLDEHYWTKMVEQSDYVIPKEKYILLYLTDKSPILELIAMEIRHITGFKVYVVGSIDTSYSDKDLTYASPFDFVGLIRDAQFVISNSFHAVAFSIIMETNFCVVNREESINERVRSILIDYDLEDRLVCGFSERLLDNINFDDVRKKREKMVSESKMWLSSVLQRAN